MNRWVKGLVDRWKGMLVLVTLGVFSGWAFGDKTSDLVFGTGFGILMAWMHYAGGVGKQVEKWTSRVFVGQMALLVYAGEFPAIREACRPYLYDNNGPLHERGWWGWLLLAIPPLAYLGVWLWQRRAKIRKAIRDAQERKYARLAEDDTAAPEARERDYLHIEDEPDEAPEPSAPGWWYAGTPMPPRKYKHSLCPVTVTLYRSCANGHLTIEGGVHRDEVVVERVVGPDGIETDLNGFEHEQALRLLAGKHEPDEQDRTITIHRPGQDITVVGRWWAGSLFITAAVDEDGEPVSLTQAEQDEAQARLEDDSQDETGR